MNKINTFISEINTKTPKKNYEVKKINYSPIDEIRSTDLIDMFDWKNPNNKGYRYIFVIFGIFSKWPSSIPVKTKNSKTITDEFSKSSTTSKRSPLKIESDPGKEFYNRVFQNFLKVKKFDR